MWLLKNIPTLAVENSFEAIKISEKIHRLILHFGFTQTLDVPKTLKDINKMGILPFELDMNTVLYLVETIEIILTPKKQDRLFFWQKSIFKMLMRNSIVDYKFFRLPYTRTVSIGSSCKI